MSTMKKILIATDETIVDENGWDYPLEEIGYILDEKSGRAVVLIGGRLRETEDCDVDCIRR